MGHFIRSLSYVKDFIFIITDFSRVKCKKSSEAAACFVTSCGWERTVNNGRITYSQSYKGPLTYRWDSIPSEAQTV